MAQTKSSAKIYASVVIKLFPKKTYFHGNFSTEILRSFVRNNTNVLCHAVKINYETFKLTKTFTSNLIFVYEYLLHNYFDLKKKYDNVWEVLAANK